MWNDANECFIGTRPRRGRMGASLCRAGLSSETDGLERMIVHKVYDICRTYASNEINSIQSCHAARLIS
jgi:hypothetical protein